MKVLYIHILVFFIAINSTTLSLAGTFMVEGNLEFLPHQHYVDAIIQLKTGIEKNADVYKERPTDTDWPFQFRISVDPNVLLENLYVKVIVRDPEGFYCKLKNLRASESKRLENIPMRSREDLFGLAKQNMEAAFSAGNIDEAKKRLNEVQWWAESPSQVLVPCLDTADFLSKYKSERRNVVKVLSDVVNWAGTANIGLQKRYWRTWRDATMRLSGYNDFEDTPKLEFANSIGDLMNDVESSKAWTVFTTSFAEAFIANKDRWEVKMGATLTEENIDLLLERYPRKENVLKQLEAIDLLLEPASAGRPEV